MLFVAAKTADDGDHADDIEFVVDVAVAANCSRIIVGSGAVLADERRLQTRTSMTKRSGLI